jgi:ubiquinone/menaquinone biosynthesis C-methylase UbiE
MGIYRRIVVPRLCHLAMHSKRLRPYREATLRSAAGRVLEIGAGSGLNLRLYPRAVREVIALEPDPALIRMARSQVSGSSDVVFLEASAELIPLPSHSVDTVVSTWTLCSIPDIRHALAEIRRVLRPDGQLLFVEHGLAADARVQKWQQRLDPVWVRMSGGCHLDRPIAALIEGSGLKMERLAIGYIPGPRIMTFLYEGAARSS